MLKRLPEFAFLAYHAAITEFRQGFALPINDSIHHTNQELHNSLHFEEFVELIEAPDLVESLDALGDMVYVIMGRIVESGITEMDDARLLFPEYMSWLTFIRSAGSHVLKKEIDAAGSFMDPDTLFDLVFAAIHSSNMTKLCLREEVGPTKEFYAKQGIQTAESLTPVGLWAIKVTKDESGKNIKAGKVLKCINYKPVDIPRVLQENITVVESLEEIK